MANGARSLRDALLDLERRASSFRQEDTLRHQFVFALEAFLDSTRLGEKRVELILEERIIKGRSDARIGGIVFEIKLPRPRGRGIDEAVQDMRDYIGDYRSRGITVRGVAYDGETISYLDENGVETERGKPSEISLTLESWLLLLGGLAVTPEDVVNILGPNSPVAQDFIVTLYECFSTYQPRIGFIDEVFNVWEGVYSVAANLNEEARNGVTRTASNLGITIRRREQVNRFLFVIETYLAVLLKLLVVRATLRLTAFNSVQSILQHSPGAVFRFADLENAIPQISSIFEDDVFIWFIDAARSDRTVEATLNQRLKATAEVIDNIDFTKISDDFLRLVYQGFFDRRTRRALGEFYTSPEIVQETLDASGYDGSPDLKVVDISCGSGTFLVEAIKRIISKNSTRRRRQLSPVDLLERISRNIIGIDIHPFLS